MSLHTCFPPFRLASAHEVQPSVSLENAGDVDSSPARHPTSGSREADQPALSPDRSARLASPPLDTRARRDRSSVRIAGHQLRAGPVSQPIPPHTTGRLLLRDLLQFARLSELLRAHKRIRLIRNSFSCSQKVLRRLQFSGTLSQPA